MWAKLAHRPCFVGLLSDDSWESSRKEVWNPGPPLGDAILHEALLGSAGQACILSPKTRNRLVEGTSSEGFTINEAPISEQEPS